MSACHFGHCHYVAPKESTHLAHIFRLADPPEGKGRRSVLKHMCLSFHIHMVEPFCIAKARAQAVHSNLRSPFQGQGSSQPFQCSIRHREGGTVDPRPSIQYPSNEDDATRAGVVKLSSQILGAMISRSHLGFYRVSGGTGR